MDVEMTDVIKVEETNVVKRQPENSSSQTTLFSKEISSCQPESKTHSGFGLRTVHHPSFDVESYSSRYAGYTKIARLLLIASTCPEVSIEAYRLAIDELKAGINTQLYQELYLRQGVQPGNDYDYNSAWVESVEKKSQQRLERLQQELQLLKQNHVKENIRMANKDLGDFYYQRGDLVAALKSFMRTRDYCTSSKNILEMCLSVITMGIHLGNYAHVRTYVAKAEQSLPNTDQADAMTKAKLNCCSGLAALHNKKYKEAAEKFICVSADLGAEFNEVIHAEDVAVYAGLCALATFSREELRLRVFENPQFKQLMELSPRVREIIHTFYNSRYSTTLRYMGALEPDLLLDLHLHCHVKSLYAEIRNRALIQYCSPYTSVDLRKMATAFSTDVEQLQRELSVLIMAQKISARIDSHKKVLVASHSDQHGITYEKALAVGRDYLRDTKALVLRMHLLRNDFIVKSGSSKSGTRFSGSAYAGSNLAISSTGSSGGSHPTTERRLVQDRPAQSGTEE